MLASPLLADFGPDEESHGIVQPPLASHNNTRVLITNIHTYFLGLGKSLGKNLRIHETYRLELH